MLLGQSRLFYRKFTNCTVIFINQLRDKIGVIYGSSETTTGGRALKFFSTVRIDIRRIDSIKQNGVVQSGRVLVDGYGVGDVGSIVLRDRKHLAEDGIIVIVMTVDSVTGEIVAGPDMVSRGFVYVRESGDLMNEAKEVIWDAIDVVSRTGAFDWTTLKTRVRDDLSHFLYERTKRSPMILPIIMEI